MAEQPEVLNRKCAPPAGSFAAVMLPPCAVMIEWQIARPMPRPLSFVVKKPSKTRSRSSAPIPGPLPRIEKPTMPSAPALFGRLETIDQQIEHLLLGLNS